MYTLPKKNGYKLSLENYVCKIVFKTGVISFRLFDKLCYAKRYSESITKKFDCVAYCEVLPLLPVDPFSKEVSHA